MRARAFAFGIVAMSALACRAFHVQTGWSGYARDIKQWIWVTNEVGKTAQRVGEGMWYFENGTVGYYGVCKYVKDGESVNHIVSFSWEDPKDTSRLSIRTGRVEYGTVIKIGERVNVPSFGWHNQYVDYRHEHGVFTCRGNPYSTVVNDTADALTVNGVRVEAGASASLLFPVHLKMDEIEGVKFYDLESGAEITPMDYANYAESGVYYHNGAYTLAWTGNIRISGGAKPHDAASTNRIMYADMKGGAGAGTPLYATNGMPVYAGSFCISTNIQLMTWWDFDQDSWGSSPVAMINGASVCDSHSTSHIVPYAVNADDLMVNEMSGMGCVYFTMSQTPASGKSGGMCVMRCWDVGAGSSTSGYANASEDHRAEVSAGLGVARFKLTVDVLKGTWKVEPN
nr:MAG TPA: hypothetical protein [Caudoviricetes sp.]